MRSVLRSSGSYRWIADSHDRLYVEIKGLCGVGLALARRGEVKAATERADELLDVGRRTGNRRAAAMGHMVAMAASFARGDQYAAKAATSAAIACEADPMYVLFARAWATGISIAGDSMEESRRQFDELDLMWRETGATVNSAQLDIFRHEIEVLDGHPSRGMANLDDERKRREAAGHFDAVMNIDLFAAIVDSRVATSEVVGAVTPPASLRDKAFVKSHRVGASKKARVALENLAQRSRPNEARTHDWPRSSSRSPSWPSMIGGAMTPARTFGECKSCSPTRRKPR